MRRSIAILLALTFSKYFYLVSITSFYTFYLIHTFDLTVQSAQLYLFIFLGAVAAGTVIGGPIGDRIGTRRVIWWSILGVLPFTLLLPYVDLFWTAVLSVIIGVILASAFPAIVVYAQGLIPGRVGMVAGLFFGVAFGIAGIGAAVLGWLADQTSIVFVYHVCAFLPAIGLLAAFSAGDGKGEGAAEDRRRLRFRQKSAYVLLPGTSYAQELAFAPSVRGLGRPQWGSRATPRLADFLRNAGRGPCVTSGMICGTSETDRRADQRCLCSVRENDRAAANRARRQGVAI